NYTVTGRLPPRRLAAGSGQIGRIGAIVSRSGAAWPVEKKENRAVLAQLPRSFAVDAAAAKSLDMPGGDEVGFYSPAGPSMPPSRIGTQNATVSSLTILSSAFVTMTSPTSRLLDSEMSAR